MKLTFSSYIIFFLCLLAAKPPTVVAPEWHGESLILSEGAVFFEATLASPSPGQKAKTSGGSLTVNFENLLNHKLYSLVQEIRPVRDGRPSIWKLPAGKYSLQSIQLLDGTAAGRLWRASKRDAKTITIKRQSISNLGTWTVIVPEGGGLTVRFGAAPAGQVKDSLRDARNVVAIIDGFTGSNQETLGGDSALDVGIVHRDKRTSARIGYRYERKISMYYKLNLFKHQKYNRDIMRFFEANDSQIRQCYTDALDRQLGIRGNINFTFLLAKNNRMMSRLSQSGGSISDSEMIKCLQLKMSQMAFEIPQTMIGEIQFKFNYFE